MKINRPDYLESLAKAVIGGDYLGTVKYVPRVLGDSLGYKRIEECSDNSCSSGEVTRAIKSVLGQMQTPRDLEDIGPAEGIFSGIESLVRKSKLKARSTGSDLKKLVTGSAEDVLGQFSIRGSPCARSLSPEMIVGVVMIEVDAPTTRCWHYGNLSEKNPEGVVAQLSYYEGASSNLTLGDANLNQKPLELGFYGNTWAGKGMPVAVKPCQRAKLKIPSGVPILCNMNISEFVDAARN